MSSRRYHYDGWEAVTPLPPIKAADADRTSRRSQRAATEEFLVVHFFHRAFGFLDGLHLHKRKTFRALVMPIAYGTSCVLHVSNAIELEEITSAGVKQIAEM